MKISELLKQVREEAGTQFSDDKLLYWINNCESMILSEVYDKKDSDIFMYNQESLNDELVVKPPHDDLYAEWIFARINYTNEEFTSYENHMARFNSLYDEYKALYRRKNQDTEYNVKFRNYY